MKHPIFKITISIVLVVISLTCLVLLFSLISSDIKAIQELNYAKAYIYTIIIIGSSVGLLLINTNLK